MATRKQIAANQRNAEKSTGPSTVEGKAISSANALRHGLVANTNEVLPWENLAELEGLRWNLVDALRPEGEMELALVEQIVGALWRLRRVSQLETGVLAHYYLRVLRERAEGKASAFTEDNNKRLLHELSQVKITDREKHAKHSDEARSVAQLQEETSPTIGSAFILDVSGPDALGKLRRYETALENSMYRAQHELLRVQATRRGQAAPLPTAVDVAVVASVGPQLDGATLITERKSPEREVRTDDGSAIEIAR